LSASRRIAVGAAVALFSLGIYTTFARSEDELWQTDFAAAQKQAKAEKKLMLVDFTGSDWCIFCKMLKEKILDTDAFKKDTPKRFVLVELDFPHMKELAPELKEQNMKLAKKYKVHGFPTVLLMDGDGAVVAKTGFEPDGPKAFLKNLDEFLEIHKEVLAFRKKLDKLEGLPRAKLLDQLIKDYVKLNNEIDDLNAWSSEIVKIDVDNKAGLKTKHQFRLLIVEAEKLKGERKIARAKAAFEKALALPGIDGEQKQDAYFAEGECFFATRDFAGIVDCLRKGEKAAPETKLASQLKQMIARFQPMADAQVAVTKAKDELAKAKGLDRAKVLDRLIDAQTKADHMLPGPKHDGDLAEWTEEIIKLDANNKVGLKTKYEFRANMSEAVSELKNKSLDKAEAALHKAQALPGLNAQQKDAVEKLGDDLKHAKAEAETKPKDKEEST
jgi:thioredoxin-related protein